MHTLTDSRAEPIYETFSKIVSLLIRSEIKLWIRSRQLVTRTMLLPWGVELQFVNNAPNHYKFTGKEWNGESGMDYFGARYYGNALGRFTSPVLEQIVEVRQSRRLSGIVFMRNRRGQVCVNI
jgi:RHS repeat-associated protein